MALSTCRDCKRDVSTSAPSCPHCGCPNPAARPSAPAVSPSSSRVNAGCLITVGVLIVLGIVVAQVEEYQEKRAASAKRSADSLAAAFWTAGNAATISPSELDARIHRQGMIVAHEPLHLTVASARLDSAERLINARGSLPVIRTLLAPPAGGLPAPLQRRRAQLERSVAPRIAEADRRAAASLRAARVTLRREFAKQYESRLLDQGIDATVTTPGREATTLRLRWILVSRVLAHQMGKDPELFASLRRLGFKRLEISDGYDEEWYWNMN